MAGTHIQLAALDGGVTSVLGLPRGIVVALLAFFLNAKFLSGGTQQTFNIFLVVYSLPKSAR